MQAKEVYLEFLDRVRKEYSADRVKDGVFGAMMEVSLVNDVSVHCLLFSCLRLCASCGLGAPPPAGMTASHRPTYGR